MVNEFTLNRKVGHIITIIYVILLICIIYIFVLMLSMPKIPPIGSCEKEIDYCNKKGVWCNFDLSSYFIKGGYCGIPDEYCEYYEDKCKQLSLKKESS